MICLETCFPYQTGAFLVVNGDIYVKKGVTDGEMRARPCSYCVLCDANFSMKEETIGFDECLFD